MIDDRMPPHDLDAEEAVLGSVLIDSDAFNRISDLKVLDFYRDKNKWVWEVCIELSRRGDVLNQVTVAHELAQKDKLEAMGGSAYLSNLIMNVPTSVHAEYYAEIVKKTAWQRGLIEVGDKIINEAFEVSDVENTSAKVSSLILDHTRRYENNNGFVSVCDAVSESWDRTQEFIESEKQIKGLTTGFTGLNRVLSGYCAGLFYVLMARPSMGKTAFMLESAKAVAKEGGRVGIFSLETIKWRLASRMIHSESGFNESVVEQMKFDNKLTQEFKDRYYQENLKASNMINELPIYIYDKTDVRVDTIRTKFEKLMIEHPVDIIFFDHIGKPMYKGTQYERVTLASNALSNIAIDFNIPVVCLCQLSRDVERRENKRPISADLRDSGHLEQDARVIISLYRDRYYNENADPYDLLEAKVLKNSEGPLGNIMPMQFDIPQPDSPLSESISRAGKIVDWPSHRKDELKK